MGKFPTPPPVGKPEPRLGRIVSILEQSRGNVLQAVNTNMALAYWLIRQENAEEIQSGKGWAKYGEQMFPDSTIVNRILPRSIWQTCPSKSNCGRKSEGNSGCARRQWRSGGN